MSSLKAFGGNNILNLTVSTFYVRNTSRFKGAGSSGSFNFEFAIGKAPVIALEASKKPVLHNVKITLSNVTIKVQDRKGKIPTFERNVPMTVYGIVGITNGVLSFTSLTVEANNTNGIDALIVGIINGQIIPRIQSALSGITLPQMQNIFGSSLSAAVQSGTVVSGPAIEINATINGAGTLRNANTPAAATITSLNNGSSSNAKIIGMVHQDALNVLIPRLIPVLSSTFSKTASAPFGFAAGISGTVSASTPVISINNGAGSASTRVSISNFRAGVKDPISGWHWVPIPVPSVDVVVTNSLSTQGNKGILTLTGVGNLSVVLNWPTILGPVQAVVTSLLNAVLNLFKGQISNAVSGKKFTLFELPARIPGTTLPATLGFPASGLSYVGKSVQAIIRVQV